MCIFSVTLSNYQQALPDDLKSKLSIDDEVASSPKEALSRASADWRVKYLNESIPGTRHKLRCRHFYGSTFSFLPLSELE